MRYGNWNYLGFDDQLDYALHVLQDKPMDPLVTVLFDSTVGMNCKFFRYCDLNYIEDRNQRKLTFEYGYVFTFGDTKLVGVQIASRGCYINHESIVDCND